MNERIQELISAYLHRGSTPEQERELFDACSRNAETAELLRQHLVLSLKIRQLRDGTDVPPEAHNSVLRRINTLEAEGLREEEQRVAAAPVASDPPRRSFGWAHLLGTGFAGAAMVALLLLATDATEPETAAPTAALMPDTVLLVRTDTLLREVQRPVYIVREIAPKPQSRQINEDGTEQLATQAHADDDARSDMADASQDPDVAPSPGDTRARPAPSLPESRPAAVEPSPALAQTLPPTATREEKTQNYLEQYNSMLVSVESVRISPQDRLH